MPHGSQEAERKRPYPKLSPLLTFILSGFLACEMVQRESLYLLTLSGTPSHTQPEVSMENLPGASQTVRFNKRDDE